MWFLFYLGPLSKKVNEKILLIFAGIIPMIIGSCVMFRFGPSYPNFVGESPVNREVTRLGFGPK